MPTTLDSRVAARRITGRFLAFALLAVLALVQVAPAVGGPSGETDSKVDPDREWKARFGRLAELAGACWMGRFEGSQMRDLHSAASSPILGRPSTAGTRTKRC
jgi:hypothetical protein